jgi:hypothetical protein
MIGPRRRGLERLFWTVLVGLFLGALFTRMSVRWMPDSATREFLTTSVAASIGPLGIDLVALAFVIGPLTLNVNALSVVGIIIVGLVLRAWL